ncbi:MAG TPA: thiamine ABC transporter substrate-binding protein [Kosmotogaceae bacterium]|nr:MAG: ABC transporter, periplasmic binding protein, thiB subfamily [Thermotogales bacterium 46_20]HAA85137.1 thiamine ABC transporter substrate-binding protein [Kosmotogaceae bacterium]
MRKLMLITIAVVMVAVVFSERLVVYTYDSLLPLARQTFPIFEKETGVKVEVRAVGDAGTLLSRLIAEKERLEVDVVIGIDDLLASRAFEHDLFISYRPDNADNIIDEQLVFDPEWRLVPYDFGGIALIYDSTELGELELSSFDDLLDPRFRRSIIVQDPRTSSTGLSFLVWTYLLYKDELEDFWAQLTESILTITLGWSDAFEKFEAGEAPIMVSYATHGAYSFHNYGVLDQLAVIPGKMGYVQTEGAGIVTWSQNRETAMKFLNFLLSPAVQEAIPLTQWMFPVTDVQLPECFDYAVRPERILSVEEDLDLEELLRRWENAIYR